MRKPFIGVLAVGLLIFVGTGCNRAPQAVPTAAPPPAAAPAPLSISSIDLGRTLNADKNVGDPTAAFKPGDTIYASVATQGAASSATLTAKWTYQDGQTVDQTSHTIAPTGPARTEFHIAKPDGWPAGKYKVEVMLNGSPAGAKDFEVTP